MLSIKSHGMMEVSLLNLYYLNRLKDYCTLHWKNIVCRTPVLFLRKANEGLVYTENLLSWFTRFTEFTRSIFLTRAV
jgi:hypothetical protein